jgi:hypothetical protein
MKSKVKKVLIYSGFSLIVAYIISVEFRPSDEIGFLGAGKVGRQALIQSLDEFLKARKTKVDSEYCDRPFIFRLLFGAPLRTTIRFDTCEEGQRIDEKMVRNYLALPHETITHYLRGNILMQEGNEISADDLKRLMLEKNVKTIEDFYAGFGFKRYEFYARGVPRVSIENRNVRNVKHLD